MYIYVINGRRMVKTVKIIALLLVLSTLFMLTLDFLKKDVTAQASAETGRVIVIDAGHGGEDSGAIGVNGSYEKDINLQIATEIGEELKSRGYTVVYTRTEDKMLYLPEENIKGMRKISDLKSVFAVFIGTFIK